MVNKKEFIKNAYKTIWDIEITNDEIDSLDESKLENIIEYLKWRLWGNEEIK